MQDDRGNWKPIDEATLTNELLKETQQQRPVIKISERCTIVLDGGRAITGRVSGFKGATITIHTDPPKAN